MEVDWLGYEVKWKEGYSMSQDTRYGKKEFCSFASLLERPWFERLWVRQEIRLAKPTVILVCGSTDLLWQRFRDAVFILRSYGSGKAWLPNSRHAVFVERLDATFSLCDDRTDLPFGDWLHGQVNDSKCSDPRDKVYAVLSMLDEKRQGMAIKSDYTKSTRQVYQDLFLRFVDCFKSLDILGSCELREHSSDMPTWVPNWSVRRTSPNFDHG